MLIWIVQYRMKEQEHDNLKVYADGDEAQKEFERLKFHSPWDYVTIVIHEIKNDLMQ